MHTAEQIEIWRNAVIDGRRRVADIERRSTYPADAEEDTLTLAEHYRIRWHQARILKALSYFVNVTPADLAAVTGIHPALLTMEVRRLSERVKMKVETERRQDRSVAFYRLADITDSHEIRAVIYGSWNISETFRPQSRGKRAA